MLPARACGGLLLLPVPTLPLQPPRPPRAVDCMAQTREGDETVYKRADCGSPTARRGPNTPVTHYCFDGANKKKDWFYNTPSCLTTFIITKSSHYHHHRRRICHLSRHLITIMQPQPLPSHHHHLTNIHAVTTKKVQPSPSRIPEIYPPSSAGILHRQSPYVAPPITININRRPTTTTFTSPVTITITIGLGIFLKANNNQGNPTAKKKYIL